MGEESGKRDLEVLWMSLLEFACKRCKSATLSDQKQKGEGGRNLPSLRSSFLLAVKVGQGSF